MIQSQAHIDFREQYQSQSSSYCRLSLLRAPSHLSSQQNWTCTYCQLLPCSHKYDRKKSSEPFFCQVFLTLIRTDPADPNVNAVMKIFAWGEEGLNTQEKETEDGQEELEQERRKMEEDMEKKGLSRLRAFVCLAAVSRLSGLAVLPVCCRDPLPPPGLPTALLRAQTQTQGCHLEAKHTCRVVSRDVIWSKKTLFLLYMSIRAN